MDLLEHAILSCKGKYKNQEEAIKRARLHSGIPLIREYNDLLLDDVFLEMEKYSRKFLEMNKTSLSYYRTKWVDDPLHQWSRQWEYPFVFFSIDNYIAEHKQERIKILDAGSGITFFPYYIHERWEKARIHCCDRDASLESIFENINTNLEKRIAFCATNLQKTQYNDKTFDIIYCISVLEHTADYELIIKEYFRILKPKGRLILTFDISLDGKGELSPNNTKSLLHALSYDFDKVGSQDNIDLYQRLKDPDILTTHYIKNINKELLPWKPPSLLKCIKLLIKLKNPQSWCDNFSLYCISLTKRQTV